MDTAEKLTILSASDFFRKVPHTDLRALAESLRVEQFHKGETVCEKGDVADRIFIVASGELEVRIPGYKGKLPRIRPGEIIGEYGLFTGQIRTADVVCLTDATFLSLEYDRFREFLDLFPDTTYALLDQTVQRLLAAQEKT
jgi:CRP-like cAMP-binding protein